MQQVLFLGRRVVDTMGTGDSFNAAFAYGFLAGWLLNRMLERACICLLQILGIAQR